MGYPLTSGQCECYTLLQYLNCPFTRRLFRMSPNVPKAEFQIKFLPSDYLNPFISVTLSHKLNLLALIPRIQIRCLLFPFLGPQEAPCFELIKFYKEL